MQNGGSGWQQRPSLFVRCFLVAPVVGGGAAMRTHAEISGKKNAITDTLQVVDKQFASSVELGRAKR